MKKLWLSERMISKAFWSSLVGSFLLEEAREDSLLCASTTAPLVSKFPSEAGSISLESSYCLWLLAKYFAPKIICEVGTYIGRSTLNMGLGGIRTVEKIYTCDGTFDCMNFGILNLEAFSAEKKGIINKIEYFGKTMSDELLKKIGESGEKIDLLFIDGRLGPRDCEILGRIVAEDCVFILDDFEGVEKGVVNCMMLRKQFPAHILMEPPYSIPNLSSVKLALMVPAKVLSLSRQQELPIEM